MYMFVWTFVGHGEAFGLLNLRAEKSRIILFGVVADLRSDCKDSDLPSCGVRERGNQGFIAQQRSIPDFRHSAAT
jgi:hypothetical protein